jgi:hypothetical protein
MGQQRTAGAWIKMAALVWLLAAGAPAWATLHKCTQPDGRVAYQDKPCENGKGVAIDVGPATGVKPAQEVTKDGKKAPSEAERLEAVVAQSQRERRRRDLEERLIPNTQTERVRHKYACDQKQQSLRDSQYSMRQNLYGKTHAAQMASEMAAAAALCDTRDRELAESLQQLRDECLALQCSRQ